MKNPLTVYTSLGIVILLASCKIIDAVIDSAGPLPRLPNWGYLTAEMNGSDWSKTYKNAYQVTHGAVSYLDEPQDVFYTLTSMLQTAEGYDREHLLFQKIPFFPKTGRHRVLSCNPLLVVIPVTNLALHFLP
jgi:hypothetical protein